MDSHGFSESKFATLLLLATQQGDANALENHLSTVINPTSYLNRVYDGENKQKRTLLTIACLNEREQVIRMLLCRFKQDLEVLNDVMIDGEKLKQQMFSNVSVLWTAAAINNFQIVKLLVEHGANVNHTTETNSTPLRAACYNGNLDMVRYLVAHDGNIHISKENNDTNLMVSVDQKHLDIVTYLVDELDCDVNVSDDNGRTPLYDAVKCGSLESVEFLLKHGARNFRAKIDQMSPLMWAAEKKHLEIMKAISSQCSLIEVIEAEELLASAFVCTSRNDLDSHQAFEHFSRALELRSIHHLSKPRRTTNNKIFGDRQECQTIDELKTIQLSVDSMYIETLLVRERLLGLKNKEYRYSLWCRGAILANDGHFHEAISYWIYEFNLRQQHSIPMDSKYLRHFASLFSSMLYEINSIPMEALLPLIIATSKELEGDKQNFNYNLCTLLFLITITGQLLEKVILHTSECMDFYRHIHRINQRNYTNLDSGMSLLHLSLNKDTLVSDYPIRHICKYPCLQTARILLRCGAAVNAFDAIGHTPLHVISSNRSPCDESILNLLCDAGAHLDYVNALGETALDIAPNLSTKQLLRSKTKLSLKCLCAQMIRKKSVLFHGRISISLVNFVEKH